MKEDWTYSNNYSIRGIDCDPELNFSALAVIQMMHGVATEQIVNAGVSANELSKRNMGWIVINQDVSFLKNVKLGSKVKAFTYPSGVEKIFTYRDYIIYDEADEIIAQSSGKFILMDLEKRKMIAIPDDIKARIIDTHSINKISRPISIKFDAEELSSSVKFSVRYFDLDINGHLNNNHYFKWMLEALNLEIFQTKNLKSIHLNFRSEMSYGAEINSNCFQLEDNKWGHTLSNDGKIFASGITQWKNK